MIENFFSLQHSRVKSGLNVSATVSPKIWAAGIPIQMPNKMTNVPKFNTLFE